MNKKEYMKAVFIFRRDLRIDDNIGFIHACAESETVVPCFIFDENQISDKNKFRSLNAIQFMLDSLSDLCIQIKKHGGQLYFFQGDPEAIVKKLIVQEQIDAVFVNRDYTTYSRLRDKKIANICNAAGIQFKQFNDLLLTEPEMVLKRDSKPYSIFTPFFKTASKFKINLPQKFNSNNLFSKKIKVQKELKRISNIVLKHRNEAVFEGGRSEGLKILRKINDFENYDKIKDFPAYDSTTKLSAHHKFGTISIRESYHSMVRTLGKGHPLIRQLFWRDFFTYVAFNFPYIFGHSFYKKYDKFKWENNNVKFNAWCCGMTGFPIIDAGMRQLNKTGFMHNRVRMIVASFLVKDLQIDWRWGEKYFATKLVDYDPCVNNGNWQWAASTGCDAQPYFRIFNPWLQQKKFDSDCVYIKKWIPELTHVSNKLIHRYFEEISAPEGYVLPIIKHGVESKKWLAKASKL